MNALINRENMKLLHVHSDSRVLCDLAWIECHLAPYYILSLQDATALKVFTLMELGMLYTNITGKDNHSFNRSQVLQVVWDLCMRVPETDVTPLEADAQAAYIKADDPKKWMYVKGARVPARMASLFEHASRRAKASEKEEQKAVSGELPALKPKRGAPVVPTGDVPKVPTAKLTPKTSNAPKRGTAKAIIWRAADEAWEVAGKPTSKADVLVLRKQIMNHLETEEHIKRGSASSELGNWHKTRAPF